MTHRTENQRGDILLAFDTVDETQLAHYHPLTHALIAARHEEGYLLGWNAYRQSWEIAGGKIEPDEDPRQCVVRELFEETGQIAENIRFCGVMKIQLQPDNRIEYGALYAGDLSELKPFFANPEITQIILWDQQSDIGYINEIDVKYLELS